MDSIKEMVARKYALLGQIVIPEKYIRDKHAAAGLSRARTIDNRLDSLVKC